MKLPWTIDQSDIVYKDPWMQLRVDQNTFQNGTKGQHGVVVKRPFTTVLPLKGNNIVMVSQIRYATQLPSLEVPMGYMEEEDPLIGAQRELQEETGYIAKHWTLLGQQYAAPAYCTQKYFAYLAEDLSFTEIKHDETEFLDIIEVPFEEALQKIQSGEISDSPTIVTILRAKTYILDNR